MIRRSAAYLACGLSFASLVSMLTLEGAGDGLTLEQIGGSLIVLGLVGVGVLILLRRPENALGPIFTGGGLLWALTEAAMSYAERALGTGALPGGTLAAVFGSWASDLAWGATVTFGFLLFPNGRLPSRRWRIVAWTTAASLAVFALTAPFAPGPLSQMPSVNNPLAVQALGPVVRLVGWIEVLFLLCVVASFASVFVRYRGAPPVERQQIKWAGYLAALLAVDFAAAEIVRLVWDDTLALDALTLSGALLFTAFPFTIGIAILRHNLYDIDVVINRTLVYGASTVSLVLVYLGSVVSLQVLFRTLTGGGSQLAIVASTLAIAALFNPLRRRVQVFIDRRFYRRKYDAQKTLAAFGAKLRDEVELDHLADEFVNVVRRSVQPAHASLWLRRSGEVGEEARWSEMRENAREGVS